MHIITHFFPIFLNSRSSDDKKHKQEVEGDVEVDVEVDEKW